MHDTEHVDVVHLSTVHPPHDNRIYRKECQALHEAEVDVVYVGPGATRLSADSAPVRPLPPVGGRRTRTLLGYWFSWRELRRLRPQLLHIHDPELIPLAWLWRRVEGSRIVFDAHEDLTAQIEGKHYLPNYLKGPARVLARALARLVDGSFDGVVAATPSIQRMYRRNRATILVQNFPWSREYETRVSAADEEPRTNPNHIVYVGMLTRERGSAVMAEAVLRSDVAPTLVFAGSADPIALDDLSGLSTQLKALGALPASEIPAVVADALCGLVLFNDNPNHLEAQPTKIFEYMAAGVPFVASDFAYWRRILEPYNCGFFVNPTDAVAVSAIIDQLASDPVLRHSMGERGKQATRQVFSFEREARRLVDMNRQMLEVPQRPR